MQIIVRTTETANIHATADGRNIFSRGKPTTAIQLKRQGTALIGVFEAREDALAEAQMGTGIWRAISPAI